MVRIARMVSLNPLAVSVTWGAGGSTKDRSLDLAGLTQLEHGIDTTLHLTCTNMVQGTVDAALRVRKPDLPTLIVLRAHPILTSLQEAKDRGIENILALRGGTAIAAPPKLFRPDICVRRPTPGIRALDSDRFALPAWCRSCAIHQVNARVRALLRRRGRSLSCLKTALTCTHSVVTAYPDGHPDRETDEDGELDHLKAKVDAGAEFIITQLFYDVDGFLQWIKKVRAKGGYCTHYPYKFTILQASQASPCQLYPVSCLSRHMRLSFA